MYCCLLCNRTLRHFYSRRFLCSFQVFLIFPNVSLVFLVFFFSSGALQKSSDFPVPIVKIKRNLINFKVSTMSSVRPFLCFVLVFLAFSNFFQVFPYVSLVFLVQKNILPILDIKRSSKGLRNNSVFLIYHKFPYFSSVSSKFFRFFPVCFLGFLVFIFFRSRG